MVVVVVCVFELIDVSYRTSTVLVVDLLVKDVSLWTVVGLLVATGRKVVSAPGHCKKAEVCHICKGGAAIPVGS